MNKAIFESMFINNDTTWGRVTSALTSEDDIGVVLRVHLITEQMIEAFCCAASGNAKFFEGFGESLTMSYAAKLKLASNFGLNKHSYDELKYVNKVRNARAHKIDNAALTEKEVSDLLKLIRSGGQEDEVDSKPFGLQVDGKSVYLNNPDNTSRETFLAIFGAIVLRVARQINCVK